ncbi:carbohydrate kinase [Parabacteroides acidifaciens]|uniref:Carbohydrate kinase n=2 Tax=Parabacteroides acidifaciens TaxID=2290935 RepID=A0A3D8HE91_9BACT|nr:carbohydrate kinase [Parabacteroides acidifaciens]MBC8601952.1 carbohydrate kinase [Parabacteroides acidifaciens]RDU49289.1 carbohydrate kinase [Parabacteroides acidifaciens]
MKQMQSNNKKPVVVGIGELLWDMLPTGKKAGGAPINFVYHASRLGAEGYAISAVGDDELGHEILKELDNNSIQYLIEKVPYPTGTVQVTLQNGIPDYVINERVAWDHLSPTSNAIDLAERADAICFGTLGQRSAQSRETIQAILSFAPDEAYRCFDINLRQHYYTKELIEESLYLANVFKINDAELAVLRDMFRLEGTDKEVAKWFIERYNLRMLVLTAGASYSTIYTVKEESTLQTPEVQVADTVGAGDAFSGALIISLLKGASLKEAHEFAVKTAAYVCTKEGAWPAYEK